MTFKMKGRGKIASIASVLSLAMGLGLTACSSTYTIGYIYATAAKNASGLVDGFKVDYQSGDLTPLEDSPVPSGGRNPVAIVATPDNKFLYVIHRDDSSVVLFAIGTDGKIYPQQTYNVTGSFPTAAAVDPSGKFLYVTNTYQNTILPDGSQQQLYTPANPGPGSVTIFPIDPSNRTLGKPSTFNVGRAPTGIVVTSNFAYVIAQDTATTANLFGFSINSSNGQLTALPGVTINPGNVVSTGFAASTTPGGILADSSGNHLYVTDQAGSQVIGYSLNSSGVPTEVGSAKTDALPAGMTIDTTGKFLYVASFSGGSINGFSFGASGQPVSGVEISAQAGTGASCLTVIGAPTTAQPSHAVYMYTSNQLGNNVSGFQQNPHDGSLIQIQNTPWVASTLPTCLVSVKSFPQ